MLYLVYRKQGDDIVNENEIRNAKLAEDIKEFILDNGLGIDVRIYFNNACYDWANGEVYNKEPYLLKNIKGSTFFEYANDETVSMSFEGKLYDIINYGANYSLLEKFDEIFKKHKCYYELGYAWSLSVYFD